MRGGSKGRDSWGRADRELIRSQHYDELTRTKIASQLAIPLGTAKSRSFRAHRRLAGLLGRLRAEAGDTVDALRHGYSGDQPGEAQPDELCRADRLPGR